MNEQYSQRLLRGALALTAILSGLVSEAVAQEPVRIGVLAFRGEEHAHASYDPTAEYLREVIGRPFVVVPMTLPGSSVAVAADDVEFVITQPANYALLEHRYGLTRMATMRNRTPAGATTRFGAVIFVRADSPYRTLDDLRGARFAAVNENGFGGFLMSEVVFREAGIEAREDLELDFCGFPMDQVVTAVRDGDADAGTVRTQILERLAAAGEIDLADFRVLNEQTTDDFPYVRSSRLYPEWAFAVARHTDHELAQQVAVALLSMPSGHPAAVAGRNQGWTVPLDYGPVHDVLRTLHRPPYENLGQVTPLEVLRQYWYAVLAVLLGIFVMALVITYISRLNGRMRATNVALEREMEERRRMEHQLLASEKMASLGQLAAGVAHEINSPLGYVYSNVGALERYLPQLLTLLDAYENCRDGKEDSSHDDIDAIRESSGVEYLRQDLKDLIQESLEGLRRMRDIVSDMKSFSHVGDGDWQIVDLRESMQSTLNIVRKTVAEKGELRVDLEPLPDVECLASQLNQVFMNLILNALDAIDDGGSITVRTGTLDEERVFVEVEDDGPGIDEATLKRIFDPFYTTKSVGEGTGLGLAISMKIAKNHGGKIEVTTALGEGTTFRVVIPRRPEKSPGAEA